MTNKFIEVVKRWRAGGEEVSVEALQANADAANAAWLADDAYDAARADDAYDAAAANAAYAAANAAAEAAYAALYAADATYAADYWVKRYEELTNDK